MKDILFLDVDGVLNRRGTKERCNGFIGADRELCDRLLEWLKAHPTVQVVLSSTWRRHDDMCEHLARTGIRWIDKTPYLSSKRGDEIAAWLNRHLDEWHRYAILDDNSDMRDDQMPYFVQTDMEVGLQYAHLAALNKIFS